MARFRGVIGGGRGEASRLGHATKGLFARVQTYSGDIVVQVFDVEGEDHVSLRIEPHDGGPGAIYFLRGSIADILNKDKHAAIVQATIAAFAPELLVA